MGEGEKVMIGVWICRGGGDEGGSVRFNESRAYLPE